MMYYVFVGISLVLSLVALSVAWFALRGSGQSSLLKRQRLLQAEFADLQETVESLLESHKRLRSRQSMRELRERRGNEPTEEPNNQRDREDAARAEAKRETRRALGVADNPVTAVLDNLAGRYGPTRNNRV